MPDCIMRPMRRQDCDALAALHALCFPDPWPAHGFNSLLATGADGFVIERKQDIVGALLYRVAAKEAEILTYAVVPSWRRLGLADRLMAQAIAALQAAGIDNFFLDVAEGNKPAIALYLKWNFTEIARRGAYYNHGTTLMDALIMNLKLQLIAVDSTPDK